MAFKITINMVLQKQREPELYAGIAGFPDVCRTDLMRSLIELAIRTPYHTIIAASRPTAAPSVGPDAGTITKKLTFAADRPEDRVLYEYFDGVPPGRRKQTARSMIMKGLLASSEPNLGAWLATVDAAPPNTSVPSTLPSMAMQVLASNPELARIAPVVDAGPRLSESSPQQASSASPPVPDSNFNEGLDELFGAISIK